MSLIKCYYCYSIYLLRAVLLFCVYLTIDCNLIDDFIMKLQQPFSSRTTRPITIFLFIVINCLVLISWLNILKMILTFRANFIPKNGRIVCTEIRARNTSDVCLRLSLTF